MKKSEIKIGFFGTPEYALTTLEKLKSAEFAIAFVVTQPDRSSGRKMILTSSPVKAYAQKYKIQVYQPENINDNDFIENIKKYNCDVFVIIGYGKIIPEEILNIPSRKSLNIHGSLLPKLRGASPIETAILNDDRKTGVTIIRMDKKMDHGPIVAQKIVTVEGWPPRADFLRKCIVEEGSDLLVSILSEWINGKIKEKEQDHSQATYTKKIEKEDGLIDFKDNPYKNFLKIQAYSGWPSAYFFKDGKRIKITEASFKDGKLIIERVIPEGKAEMNYR